MMKTYYLAYGSNLNVNQMRYRCPNAIRMGKIILKDYELEFRTFLTIVPKKGASVPIGVWLVDAIDERRLDAYEGYPTFYRKEYVDVEIHKQKVKALVYIMNDVRGLNPPSIQYLNTCAEGYEDFDMDLEPLKEAYKRSLNCN